MTVVNVNTTMRVVSTIAEDKATFVPNPPKRKIIAPSKPPIPPGVGVKIPTIIPAPAATTICKNSSGWPNAHATIKNGKSSIVV